MSLTVSHILSLVIRAALVFWVSPLFLYAALPNDVKKSFVVIICAAALIALAGFLVFPGDYGDISSTLQFGKDSVTKPQIVVLKNLAVLIVVFLATLAVFTFGKGAYLSKSLGFLAAVGLVLAGVHIRTVRKGRAEYASFEHSVAVETGVSPQTILLSRTEPNTLVIFLDRAMAWGVYEALERVPDFTTLYGGFTWYPDTLSFGPNTITALSAMSGGYEYTPDGMSARSDVELRIKVFEGMQLLPELFRLKGDRVYYYNTFYQGFGVTSDDMPVFRNPAIVHPELDSLIQSWFDENSIPRDFGEFIIWEKALFRFSLFRMAPMLFRPRIYDNGYWGSLREDNPELNFFLSLKNRLTLYEEWAILTRYPDILVGDDGDGSFVFIGNNVTHEGQGHAFTSDYTITSGDVVYPQADIEKYGNATNVSNVYLNISVLIELSSLWTSMKKHGVYDNTQIVVIGDHGHKKVTYHPFIDSNEESEIASINGLNPLLMVKPYDSDGPLVRSDDFMTNADLPSIVLEPHGEFTNPFTGRIISNADKNGTLRVGYGPNKIAYQGKWEFNFDREYLVSDSMLNTENWEIVE